MNILPIMRSPLALISLSYLEIDLHINIFLIAFLNVLSISNRVILKATSTIESAIPFILSMSFIIASACFFASSSGVDVLLSSY
jgi:hypothetical protein